MLAQNFKTAVELEITDKEHSSLQQTLAMLERGELTHVPVEGLGSPWNDDAKYYEGKSFSGHFNMVGFAESTHCGTAACIAGTCDLLFGTTFARQFNGYGHLSVEMNELFASEELSSTQMKAITPSQAAIALRNYLTHGEPRWAEAIA